VNRESWHHEANYVLWRKLNMDSAEFRIFLDLLMSTVPWIITSPNQSQELMIQVANKMARNYGQSDWIDAYITDFLALGPCRVATGDNLDKVAS
jgi:hypothetical protein